MGQEQSSTPITIGDRQVRRLYCLPVACARLCVAGRRVSRRDLTRSPRPPMTARSRIPSLQLRMKSKIAEGGYSFVYLVEDVVTLKTYALKRCVASDANAQRLYEDEIKIMRQVANGSNQYIVNFLGSAKRDQRQGVAEYYMLLEYCTGSVLSEMQSTLDRGHRFNEQKVFTIFTSGLKALMALHSLSPPVAHRDIKVRQPFLSSPLP